MQNIAENIEETTGYKITPEPEPIKEEFVKFVDPIAKPQELESVKSQLKPTETIDKSKPQLDINTHIQPNHHKELLEQLNNPTLLKPVTEIHDASAPLIDQNIHIKEAPQKLVIEEITQPHQLHHVRLEELHDKSAPIIPPDVHIEKKEKAH